MAKELAVHSIVLAERVYTADGSKKIIVGTFDTVNSAVFPFTFPSSPALYLMLEGEPGQHTAELRFVNVDTGKRIMFANLAVNIGDVGMSEAVVQVPPLPFAAPGEYALQFVQNDKVLARKRLFAKPLPKADAKSKPSA